MIGGNSHSLEKSLMESRDTESSIAGLWDFERPITAFMQNHCFLWKPLALHHRVLKIVNLSLSYYTLKFIFTFSKCLLISSVTRLFSITFNFVLQFYLFQYSIRYPRCRSLRFLRVNSLKWSIEVKRLH